MSKYIYPQLADLAARRILDGRRGCSLRELFEQSVTSDQSASPKATGGHPVTEAILLDVRDVVREVADAAGFPAMISPVAAQAFDRPCGTKLLEVMQIVPADAGTRGVWTFLSVVLIPEIGPWRFPSLQENRLLGHPRNVLRRLWDRAFLLGPDLDVTPVGNRPLGEDEFVQIMERPTLASTRRTASAIRDAVWRAERDGLRPARSTVMREVTRRLLARKSYLLLEALSDQDLRRLLDAIVAEASATLLREGAIAN